MELIVGMFTLLKSGWSNLLRGDANSKVSLKQNVISSDEEFIFIPNRKRSHVSSIYSMNNGTDFKVKKEDQHSPTSDSDATSVHLKFASSVENATTTVSAFMLPKSCCYNERGISALKFHFIVACQR